jgi:DNA-binding response OmpR family regulator
MQARFGSLTLDPTSQSARVGGRDLSVTRTEYRMLEALCSTPKAPWSRARLLERVFGWDYDGSERTIDTHVTNVRRKLTAVQSEDAPEIVTVFGLGYKIVCRT